MCGIAGLRLTAPGPVGKQLELMAGALRHRGPDATGFALYGPAVAGLLVVRLRVVGRAGDADAAVDRAIDAAVHLGHSLAAAVDLDSAPGRPDRFGRLVLTGAADPDTVGALAVALEGVPGVEVQSIGASLEVVKDEGDAATVSARHGVADFVGTHGLGHTRLATESEVGVRLSHPFWARPFPDVAIVHNGQLTNYYKLRRLFEQRGYGFQTGNDSELIAVYVASRLHTGATLTEALEASLAELDGTYTYLISTPEGIGFCKDRWSAKPLVVAETDEVVAMATEDCGLRAVFPHEVETSMPAQRTVGTWLATS